MTDISATVIPIGVRFCMMVDMGPRAVPEWVPKSKILTANISKMVSCSITCQMRAFQKCIAWDSSPQGSPMENMYFFGPGTDLALTGMKICTTVALS